MITQTIKQGENSIRIENAETIEDAKKNNFKTGEYCRYFVNNVLVSNYMELIKYIIDETKRNKSSFVPNSQEIKKIRQEMSEKIKNDTREQMNAVKEHYKNINLENSLFNNIDEMLNKLDDSGVRVVE